MLKTMQVFITKEKRRQLFNYYFDIRDESFFLEPDELKLSFSTYYSMTNKMVSFEFGNHSGPEI